jgi:hypothetical protein
MRDWNEVRGITGAFIGMRKPLLARANFDALLRVLSEGPMPVTHWGPFERTHLSLVADDAFAKLRENKECMLYRRSTPKWDAHLLPRNRYLHLSFELPTSTAPKHWPTFFALMDAVAACVEPDFASVHILEEFANVTPARDRKISTLVEGTAVDGRAYELYGVQGLCMRNYFGPAWIAQFGRKHLLSLPIPVTELPWGGIRTELCEEPWNASLDELYAGWERGMAHLRATGLMPEWIIREDPFVIKFVKSPTVVIPVAPQEKP